MGKTKWKKNLPNEKMSTWLFIKLATWFYNLHTLITLVKIRIKSKNKKPNMNKIQYKIFL